MTKHKDMANNNGNIFIHFKISAFLEEDSHVGHLPHSQRPNLPVDISLQIGIMISALIQKHVDATASALQYLRTHDTVTRTFPASDVANAWSNWGRTCRGGSGKRLEFQATS